MLIKVLIENTAEKDRLDLKPQHGISLYLETLGRKIVFDLGQNHFFLENAQKLAVKVEEVDWLVISHGHYDHGGGLASFLHKNKSGTVFLSQNSLTPFYARRSGHEMKYIGLDVELISSHTGRFVFVSETNVPMAPGIVLLANTCFNGFRPGGNDFLYKKINDQYVPDDFHHELMLVVSEPDGDVVFTGCSHSGVTNMLRSYRAYFPRRSLKALVGGFHLTDSSSSLIMEPKRELQMLAKEIRTFRPLSIYTGHCTGDTAFQLLSQELGEVINRFRTGSEFTV